MNQKLWIGVFALMAFGSYFFLSRYYLKKEIESDSKKWSRHNEAMKDLAKEQGPLVEEIKKHAGTGRCKTDQDCRSIGLGVKKCGYFSDYFHYSLLEVDLEKFSNAVSKFNANAIELDKRSLRVKSCGKPPPRTLCANRVCLPETVLKKKRRRGS